MGVTSYGGRARRALLHKDNSVYWVGIGRTTSWTNEASPPAAAPGTTSIEEPICFVKPQMVSLVKPVNSGEDITVLGQKYAYVADENAVAQGARFLYIMAKFDPTLGQPYGNFRQVGVTSDLVPATGYDTASWLDPANVDSPGLLEYLHNDAVTNMSLSRQEVIEIIIEFR